MIIVKVMAGLGNQMFQYATARRLAASRGTELKLDITSFDNMHKDDTPRRYELDKLNIAADTASPEELSRIKPAEYQRKLHEKVAHRVGKGARIYHYGERSANFDPKILKLRDNTYLVGWWQNQDYFKDIADVLRIELAPKNKATGKNAKLLEQIADCTSVSLHVRRGDLVTNKHANKFHGLAPIDYYRQAVEMMRKKTKNPRFFVFSDDIAWCKKNLKLGKSATFVDWNTGAKAFEDIRLMSACQHNIIANSSFSWWGAWLNPNPKKIVIAPKVWFQDPKANAETQIVPKEWVRL